MTWNLKYFVPSEFPGQATLADDDLLLKLDSSRFLISQRIFPSPAYGALARFGGSKTSQHYVGKDPNHIIRKATAIDVFAEGTPMENFQLIYGSGLFTGIGLYLSTRGPDGKPWVMMHLDTRPVGYENMPLIWIAKKVIVPGSGEIATKYFYPQHDSRHWAMFQNDKLFQERYR